MKHPTFVRIEYWNENTGEWWVGHASMNLMDPQKYIQKLLENGTVGRAVGIETGEEFNVEGGELL